MKKKNLKIEPQKALFFRVKHVVSMLLNFVLRSAKNFMAIGKSLQTYKKLKFITTLDNWCEILSFSTTQFRCMYVTGALFLKKLLDMFKNLLYFGGNAIQKTRLLLYVNDVRQNCFKVVINLLHGILNVN